MYLVLLLAAIAIIGGVVVVAMGRGGELALAPRDLPLTATELRTPADVALVRLPLAPLGYQIQATSEALTAAARLLAARDAELSALRAELRTQQFRPDDSQPVAELGPDDEGTMADLPSGVASADEIRAGEIPAANLDKQQGS